MDGNGFLHDIGDCGKPISPYYFDINNHVFDVAYTEM